MRPSSSLDESRRSSNVDRPTNAPNSAICRWLQCLGVDPSRDGRGIKQTLKAAGASFKACMSSCCGRGRAWVTSVKASAVINSYFAPFNQKPTSTNVAVLELGEPEQLIEI